MTVKTICVCVLALFLAAPVTLGEVVEYGDYDEQSGGNGTASADYTSSSAGSQSNGSSPSGWGGGEGEQELITTVGGTFHCSYYVNAYAVAELYLYSGQYCAAQADAYAYADLVGIDPGSRSASASATGSGTGGTHVEDEFAPGPDYDAWTGLWSSYDGPYAYHYSVAASTVPSGTSDTAYASASATAWVTMSEQ
jgi:hypothetical protein